MDPIRITEMSTEDLRKLLDQQAHTAVQIERRGKFALWRPFPHQRPVLECTKKIILAVAGNQWGKTELGAVKTVSGCVGTMPTSLGGQMPHDWSEVDRIGRKYLACGENFTSAIPKTILPKLEYFIATDMLEKPPKRGSGTKLPEIYYFKSGAQLHIMSYDQDPASFEGAVWDGVWFDEPPPEAIFTAVRRGTMARQGWILITATPIKEPWMFDALVAPLNDPDSPSHEFSAVFRGDIHDNCRECFGGALPHSEIQSFLSGITNPAERAARERGEFLDMAGVEFWYCNRDSHVCPDLW
ncbi:MAG: terminase large subunit domain-containing protein [Steroidobacteraceae bacterium]